MKTKKLIKKAIDDKIKDICNQLSVLVNYTFSEEDIYYKVLWSDPLYPDQPEGYFESNSFEKCVSWLSEQSHPMEFSGCHMELGMYIDFAGGLSLLIKSFPAEKLAKEKLNR